MSDIDHLPPGLREALLAEIDPGEAIVWCGVPSPERAFRLAIGGAVFGTLVFGGIGLVPFVLLLAPAVFPPKNADPDPLVRVVGCAIIGAVLIAVGLVCASTPWWARGRARRTVHAITPTRIMTVRVSAPGRSVVEGVEPGHPLHLSRTDVGGGRADILIYPGHGRPLMQMDGVENGREVDRLIRETFNPPG